MSKMPASINMPAGAAEALLVDGSQFWTGGRNLGSVSPILSYSFRSTVTCPGCNPAMLAQNIQVCLTVNGATCATTPQALQANAQGRVEQTLSAEENVSTTLAHARTGKADCNGQSVTQISGEQPFWSGLVRGSRIKLGGVEYKIARLTSDVGLELDAASNCNNLRSVDFAFENFGVLVRKSAGLSSTVTITNLEKSILFGGGVGWDSSGSGNSATHCSKTLVQGPGGEMGYHCTFGNTLYWMGSQSGKMNPLGTSQLRPRSGPGGWPSQTRLSSHCSSFGGAQWSEIDPNRAYCPMLDNSNPDEMTVVELRYQGNNAAHPQVGGGDVLPECGIGLNSNCFVVENILRTQNSGGLSTLLRQFVPAEYDELRPTVVRSVGHQEGLIMFTALRGSADNDMVGILFAFDPSTRQIVAALPSWKVWPLRWTVLHGYGSAGYRDWSLIPATMFRGPFTGKDSAAGNGPYVSRVTSGNLGSSPGVCPARPANSPIPAADWPTGNRCASITVEGEPCDPTPFSVNGVGDLVGNPKCGSSSSSYLQDAEVRDIFMIHNGTSDRNYANGGFYLNNEYVRLLQKNGNTWVVQRAYGQNGSVLNNTGSLHLFAMPASCQLGAVYPCEGALVYWNMSLFPKGSVAPQGAMVADTNFKGGGHGDSKPGGTITAVADTCSKRDEDGHWCGYARLGSLPEAFAAIGHRFAINVSFEGLMGVGTPNSVDSHPTFPGLPAMQDSNNIWGLDARPFLGDSSLTGKVDAPGRLVSGQLYQFSAAQMRRLRRKFFPTMAACGSHVLLDISGPNSSLADTPQDSYKYCVAARAGECNARSAANDVWVNCPAINQAYCTYPGIANSEHDKRDICIGDKAAYTNAITQIGIRSEDLEGQGIRVLTTGLTHYRLYDVFWNVKSTPDGKWLLARLPWTNGVASTFAYAKLPPFPERAARPMNGFAKVPVRIPASNAGSHAAIEFGYDASLRCTTRLEACVKGAETSTPFVFPSAESLSPVSCSGGCSIDLPVHYGRVYYYRVLRTNSTGQVLSREELNVAAAP